MFAGMSGVFKLLVFAPLALGLAGCATGGRTALAPAPDPEYVAMYAAHPDERFPLPATDISKIDPRWLRQQVAYDTPERPGTLVVDTRSRFLYLVQEDGMAMRYGIGVGKAGLEFAGAARVGRKAQWPRWTPTPSMIEREPDRYGPVAGGVGPGLENPLGPRALYLFQGDRDTLFRIHGTTEPWSIGRAVSSGCIRMFNQDVIDLHRRVPIDTPVVVLQDDAYPFESEPIAEAPAVADGFDRRV